MPEAERKEKPPNTPSGVDGRSEKKNSARTGARRRRTSRRSSKDKNSSLQRLLARF
jgi:hypothetical protein